MDGLRWSWLAAPYVACTATIAAVAIAAALIRGDRVMRLGMIGAAITALPWSLCQALAAMASDPTTAMHLLKLGQGPVALVGPNLLLVLLAVSGQLERFRWLARIAPLVGVGFLILAWTTAWVTPGVQLLPSGLYYFSAGPLTGFYISQVILWLIVGIVIVRRSTPRGERKRTQRLLVAVLLFSAIGSIDALLLYGVGLGYPVAWFPATIAAAIALYLVLKTDLVRPQGLDVGVALELGAFVVAIGATIALAVVLADEPTMLGVTASLVWTVCTAIAWGVERARPPRVADGRALEAFVARVATFDDAAKIASQLAALWKSAIGIVVTRTSTRAELALDPEVIAWLVKHAEPLAVTDLATMRLGAMRPKLEELGKRNELIVPLVDRDELVGLVEADYELALRDAERALVAESARAAARAFTFVGLAKGAAREHETAREVEVADALRLQASASRDAELGQWAVAAEYRTAPRTTGAGWSAIELPDGRLALLATEAQAHGVAAALATAALTGAFAAATTPGPSGSPPLTIDELLRTMRASSEGVIRGGEPVATFLAILDAAAHSVEWACAGHPGAFLVGPIATVDTSLPAGSGIGGRAKAVRLGAGERAPGASLTVALRGTTPLPVDTLLVVASSALRGPDDALWQQHLRESAPASGRLATVLVEHALKAHDPTEDLLAVVVRSR